MIAIAEERLDKPRIAAFLREHAGAGAKPEARSKRATKKKRGRRA